MRFLEDTAPDSYQPPGANEFLWRYMTLARFAALAVPRYDPQRNRYSMLYLSRADLLGDPFEGSIPSPEKRLRAEDPWFADFPDGYNDAFRKWTFVNCWHRNPVESAALWRLYAQEEGSVAIRSSYSRIRAALAHVQDAVGVSRVEYIDYETQLFRLGQKNAGSQPFLHKRLSFKHEDEVRIVTTTTPPARTRPDGRVAPADFLQDQPNPGRVFFLDLATLVEAVYVAPDAPGWIKPTIESMLASWGWSSIPVRQSNTSSPLF